LLANKWDGWIAHPEIEILQLSAVIQQFLDRLQITDMKERLTKGPSINQPDDRYDLRGDRKGTIALATVLKARCPKAPQHVLCACVG
jgi:hypothetical protein